MADTAADYQAEAVTLAQQTAEYQHATQTATLTGRIFMEAQRCVKPKNGTCGPRSLSNK
jgi:hypothetical protein